MSTDWMTSDHQPKTPGARQYAETPLWVLTKNERFLSAVIRHLPDRNELRIACGDFFEHFAFPQGDPRLGLLADEKRRDFEARGWRAV